MTNNTDVPIWEKYTLTIEEASKYFRIGEKKLRKLADCHFPAYGVNTVVEVFLNLFLLFPQ